MIAPNMQQIFAVSEQGLMERVNTQQEVFTSLSNNLGYFHQAFFIHDIDVQNLNKKAAKYAQKNSSHSPSQGAVSIQQFSLQTNKISAGQELEITAMIQSKGASNSALQLLVYAIDPKNNEKSYWIMRLSLTSKLMVATTSSCLYAQKVVAETDSSRIRPRSSRTNG